MRLYPIGFIHYSPKDSEQGVKEYVLADDAEEVIQYVSRKYMYAVEGEGGILGHDEEEQNQDHCVFYDKNGDKISRAKLNQAVSLGFEVDFEYGSVHGPKAELVRWHEGNDFLDVDDAYYGVTHFNWSGSFDVSDEDAEVLIRLGLAKRI